MDPATTGAGYLSDAITAAVIAFLILLAAVTALNLTIARRYHTSRHRFAGKARRLQNRAATAGAAHVRQRTRHAEPGHQAG